MYEYMTNGSRDRPLLCLSYTSLQSNINIYLIVETRKIYGYINKKIELVHSV